jgi:hypothetical protein
MSLRVVSRARRAARASSRVVLAALVLSAASASAAPKSAAPMVVDAFESTAPWTTDPASGVSLALASDAGARGRAMRMDFDFHGGGGYAVAHRAVDLTLPADYRLTFRVRGVCGRQNLEFKLIDDSGENVWWVNSRDFAFDPAWRTVTFKKRHVSFAWGPAGGGEPRHIAAIEFAVTAGSGGAGSVWLDELTLEAVPPPPAVMPEPVARASSAVPGHAAALALDPDTATSWVSRAGDPRPALELDLGVTREFGGLVLDWEPGRHAVDYDVELADAKGPWRLARAVRGGNGGRDALYLPESEARRVRVRVLRAAAGVAGTRAYGSLDDLMDPSQRVLARRGSASVALRALTVQPLAWSASIGAFFGALAAEAPRGVYPRGLRGEQSYWAVIGVDDDRDEALLGEDGALEIGKALGSIEPFLSVDGRLVTWADVSTRQWLEQGDLPVPTVRWDGAPFELEVTAFADGTPGAASLIARYRVRNRGTARRAGTLYLALRPFQVNPPTQFLNQPGGVATLRSIAYEGRTATLDSTRRVVSWTAPDGFGAVAFDQGDVLDFLREGRLPAATAVVDPFAHASGAFAYALDLAPGETREIDLMVPLQPMAHRLPPAFDAEAPTPLTVEKRMAQCVAGWRARLSRVSVALPDTEVTRALAAQVGWILVNRDRGAIQPGSRSYERSWIRDGSLTSVALLRLGHADVVKEFLTWFAPFQYADGKVPCCVDARGADPVPEHDSHGEFVYLVAEYLRLTGDRAFVETLWPHVRAAIGYLDALRAQRRTPEWSTPERAPFFGLLPPSISHEGYSAKPMHSYWDDLFALRGYTDAAWLARTLGHDADAARIGAARDTFATDLGASIRAAMAAHHIDHVPGCADLGDFDATSTTIALNPVQASESVVPRAALERTFARYWDWFRGRRDGAPWDAFTPYEWRNVGAMARLGMRAEADSALTWLMGFRRPAGFQQWAEVVDHDERHPRFIGDMPHTWCGSDFVRSVLDLLAYEREADSALVVGAGVPERWLAGDGLDVRGLRTRWGTLFYSARDAAGERVAEIGQGDLRMPPGGVAIELPAPRDAAGRPLPAWVEGRRVEGPLVLRKLPARVTWRVAPAGGR